MSSPAVFSGIAAGAFAFVTLQKSVETIDSARAGGTRWARAAGNLALAALLTLVFLKIATAL